MKYTDYLDRLLLSYADTFDIYMPYQINGREYPAYGYFFSSVEKYVLVRDANMWTSDCHEHILFLFTEAVTEDTVREVGSLMGDYFEPELVRKGQRYPDKNHMYSYLTVVVLADKPLTADIRKRIRRFRFEKGYLFNFRGFCQGRLLCATMEDEKVACNYQASRLKKLFLTTFADVHEGKETFSQRCKEEGTAPYTQELC